MGATVVNRSLAIAVLLSVAWAAPCLADDFAAGLEAYDAGDLEAAAAVWQPLAEAGDPEAQVALADLLLSGQGVPRDTKAAVRWYRRAAEQGDPVAQLNLGDFHRRGLGVERDKARAYFWFTLAARQGRRWAEEQRRAIGAEMTATELAAAEALLARWDASR